MRCAYCMPPGGLRLVPRAEILTWEEMLRLCRIFAGCGVRKIRLTGGEPLVRPGLVEFLRRLRESPGSPELALTTNATLLERYALPLRECGLERINVSLDSLNRDRFADLSRRDLFREAWRGLEAADACGFEIKLNVVVIAGVNDVEIPDFIELAGRRNWTVRFIEAMPFDGSGSGTAGLLDGDAILGLIAERYSIEPATGASRGVAELYRVLETGATIGLIRGYTRTFCRDCSRIRVNAAGRLRTCLYGAPALDLRSMLRGGFTDAEIAARLAVAVWRREAGGLEAHEASREHRACSMSRIGG